MVVAVGILAPVEQRGALRELVLHLAVGALAIAKKFEGPARTVEIAVIHDAPRVHERIAAEIPGEAGPLALARAGEAGHQPAAHAVVAGPALLDRKLRPMEGLVKRRVGRLDTQRAPVELPVILVGLAHDPGDVRQRGLV